MHEIGPQHEGDNAIVKNFRLIQSKYRAMVLKQDCGRGPNEANRNKFGNMLVNGEKTGSNFLSPHAFAYAKHKVMEKQVNPFLTIERYRLFNNMLSSQPLCFNLFSDLRFIAQENPGRATQCLRALLPEAEWLASVTYVDIEFIPLPPCDYTNDKSAFDALVIGADAQGKTGIITIETKYSDVLGQNSSHDTACKDQLVNQCELFTEELATKIKAKGYTQLHRNFLLTVAYAKRNHHRHFMHVVISPSRDVESKKEIEAFQAGLKVHRDKVRTIALEDFLKQGIACGDGELGLLYKRIFERYFGG